MSSKTSRTRSLVYRLSSRMSCQHALPTIRISTRMMTVTHSDPRNLSFDHLASRQQTDQRKRKIRLHLFRNQFEYLRKHFKHLVLLVLLPQDQVEHLARYELDPIEKSHSSKPQSHTKICRGRLSSLIATCSVSCL